MADKLLAMVFGTAWNVSELRPGRFPSGSVLSVHLWERHQPSQRTAVGVLIPIKLQPAGGRFWFRFLDMESGPWAVGREPCSLSVTYVGVLGADLRAMDEQ